MIHIPHLKYNIRVDRFKTSLQFINVPYKSVYSALDACKAADYVVFVLSSTVEVDNGGDVLLRLLQAQGLPEVITVVSSNDSLDSKLRSATMKSLLSFIQYFVPTQTRVFDLQASFDRLNAVRALSEGLPGGPRWREGRTWVLGENTQWDNGTLKITGVVRGAALSANRLVHIPNYGDFQISKVVLSFTSIGSVEKLIFRQIASAPVPQVSKSGISIGMDVEPVVLAEGDPSSADSLVSTNDLDDLANEQTWPTEEEMQVTEHAPQAPGVLPDARAGTTPKTVKRIPKGMSEYQAAWIIDSDEDIEDEGTDTDVRETETENVEEEVHDVAPAEEDHDMETESRQSVTFQDLDIEEEAKQFASFINVACLAANLISYRLEAWRDREREEKDDAAFPDELDTPKDIAARVRFQRFRGLKSFRTSPWDPYENLPRDYARIFQFEDFRRTERTVRRRAEEEGVVQVSASRQVFFHCFDKIK
jgi:pre-rRNA-processing protein TSR1